MVLNQFAVIKQNWKLIAYANAVEIVAFVVALAALFIGKKTRHCYALVIFIITENIGGLGSILLLKKVMKVRQTS